MLKNQKPTKLLHMKANFLLRIKNWQLFFMILILPFIIAILYELIMTLLNGPRMEILANPLTTILYFVVFVLWNYSVIKYLDESDKTMTENNKKTLKYILIYLAFYIAYIIGPLLNLFTWDLQFFLWKAISLLSHFIMALSLITLIYFSAKSIKFRQLGDQIRTSDIIIEMLIIGYFPLGLWWLQPRLNKIVKLTKKQSTNR